MAPGSDVRELASGVDALYLSGRAELPTALLERLGELRAEAEATESPVPLQLAGRDFVVEPRSFGKHRFRLRHEHGLIGVTSSTTLPALRVQPRAEFLHGVGTSAALEFFAGIGEYLAAGPVSWSLSRLDLFCDVQGWTVDGDDREHFVCRSKRLDLHEDGAAFTGLEFGRRTTTTITARIYDKTREIEAKGADWWPSVWGENFDSTQPVLRVEFELGRKGLTEFGIDTPAEGLAAAGRLWASVTGSWLSYRCPTPDATRSRWPVASEWVAIQNASLAENAIGMDRVRAGKREGGLRKLTPALVGYLASAGALLELDDVSSTLAGVRWLVHEDERRRGIPFSTRIAERARELA